MKTVIIYCPLLALLMAFSCEKTETTPEASTTLPNCDKIAVVEDFSKLSSEEYRIDSAYVKGKCLAIRLSYGGDCSGTKFQLFSDNRPVIAIYPTQMPLRLIRTGTDGCKRLTSNEISFDLSGIKGDADILLEGVSKKVRWRP